jgi:NADH-quinone oxidoreductase subunit A
VNASATYLSGFATVLLFIIGAAAFLTVTLLVSRLLRPARPNADKLATYESGEEAIGSPHPQFNIRFYVVALMFLLFEIELVFLFPWATVFTQPALIEQTQSTWGWFSLLEVVLFVLILAVGLAYAWANGYLNWAESKQEIPTINSPVPKKLYESINKKYGRE